VSTDRSRPPRTWRHCTTKYVVTGYSRATVDEACDSFFRHGCHCLLQAIHAGAERNRIAEAYHLLKAKKWNRSHSVVMQHIASDAVVNGIDSL